MFNLGKHEGGTLPNHTINAQANIDAHHIIKGKILKFYDKKNSNQVKAIICTHTYQTCYRRIICLHMISPMVSKASPLAMLPL